MYARDIFTGLGPNWADVHYEAPTGQLGGDATFLQASVLFMVNVPISADVALWGNYDDTNAAQKGWELGITSAGLLRGRYGTGAAEVVATFDPGPLLMRKWCLLSMFKATGGDLGLFVNGALVDTTTDADLVPNTGIAALGNNPAGTAPLVEGLIAGCTYNNVSAGLEPFSQGSNVARTGQIGLDIYTDLGNVVIPQSNAWQVPFYNVGGGATWAPVRGAVSLTRVGDAAAIRAIAASSNAWL
jgi:hypothetical protein